MWFETSVTNRLKITYPIIQAGMAGGVTTPELIAKVSNAGGLGSLGAGYMNPGQMREAIQKVKLLTSNPFSINVFIPEGDVTSPVKIDKANAAMRRYRDELGLSDPETEQISASVLQEEFKQKLQILIEEEVPICSFTFGIPSNEEIQLLKDQGLTLIGTATTVNEALLNEERGMDLVVMQGSEAGGHRGTFTGEFDHSLIGTVSLIPQTVDRVSIPVIAAGGIMDGRGILAALALGAGGVQMGTAFVTSKESGANPLHKSLIMDSTEDQVIVTSKFSGKPARGIHNQFMKEMAVVSIEDLPGYPMLNSLTKDIRGEAAKQHRPEFMSLWSGQSPRLSGEKSAQEIVIQCVKQVERSLRNLT
ncbi:nitronate monooxygenase [Pseudalkalibacillus hwajinpoensis]|uniref:nitronate monooxygenase n=1 Tax=Guptibacillus hwajinpoensis TaxID=208199 RepID=UPI00325A97C4